MIQIKQVLPSPAECFMCKKLRQAAVTSIDGQKDVVLCAKHIWQVAELYSQSQPKEKP